MSDLTGPAPTPLEIVLEGMAQQAELLQLVAEAMAGYRLKLEEQGFSPTAAEAMAVQYHVIFWQNVRGQSHAE